MKVLHPELTIRLKGFGRAWPARKVTNLDLLRRFPREAHHSDSFFATMEKRILENYGVAERGMTHLPGDAFSDDEETSESLALAACRKALAGGGDVDLFVLGSTTSSRYTGSQAASILGRLGLVAPAYEMKAGCSTSLAGLHMAYGFLSGGYDNVLVAAAETLSKVANPAIKESWFGLADGAAAVWLEKSSGENPAENSFRVLRSFFSTQGRHVDLYTTQGSLPPRTELIEAGGYFLNGDSAQMRLAAKEHYLKTVEALLPDRRERQSLRWIIPHQVSRPLIDEVIRETGLSGEVLWHGREFGNIGGASVLFSLSDALERKIFRRGDTILLMSVGGGLSFAGQLWQVLSEGAISPRISPRATD